MKKKLLMIMTLVLLMGGAIAVASTSKDEKMEKETVMPDVEAGPVVDIKTTMGDIKVKLYDDTPIHRDNFLKLVKEGFYDGVLFHRVINDFMVQTGDPDSRTADSTAVLGSGDPSYTLEAEINYPRHYHKYGALAAARTADQVNPQRRSSGSQFYIVTGTKLNETAVRRMEERSVAEKRQKYFRQLAMENEAAIDSLRKAGDREGFEALRQRLIEETEKNVPVESLPENIKKDYIEKGGTPHLDGAYTVFGEVLEGMDVVEKIQKAETDRNDRPKTDIRILKMTIEK